MQHTFVICDLAGFTAMTEAHGDDHAADIAEAFIADVRAMLPTHEAREVKTMGDAVLLHLADASRAVCLARCAVGELGARHAQLSVRVGLHTGPAVQRAGDWFGAAVNIAARVAALAGPDEALTTAATAAACTAGEREGLTSLGPTALRNVAAPVELYRLQVDRGPDRLHRDPVCRMAVDPSEAPASVQHEGQAVHFCSAACAESFRVHPELYAERR
ncbi:YHS domain-containing protein [Paraconexibacter antarcticus]|uniref:YHS domain-containing protein n=1 Tax=Paraconexibacter antarcticus TaxID=2949664 RepID=A0ABY5DRB8_9ACTN|nr:adenylate/guanylate cyclase domain-containing protein [Paraconexibacter antarcticus]UTI63347.1 YHS domain-containing protein [Paraconexibacter antarcticus]